MLEIETKYHNTLDFVKDNYPHKVDDYIKHFSKNNTWLIEELSNVLSYTKTQSKKIVIFGSRYGSIVPLLVDKINTIQEIELIDMDGDALNISTKYFGYYGHYKQTTIYHIEDDINFMSFKSFSPDIVINTHCDRMFPMSEIEFDNNVLYVLQSSNMINTRENINCVNSTTELALQANINYIYMEGYNEKFMVIGKRM